MKKALLLFNALVLFTGLATAKEFDTRTVRVSQFQGEPSTQAEFEKSIKEYLGEAALSGKVSAKKISALAYKNVQLEYQIRKTLYDAGLQDFPYQQSVDGRVTEFKFKSLIQNADHPSNTVHGFIYRPSVPYGCELKFPATLVIHHVGDDLGPEQMLAKTATAFNKGIVMLIYLPKYGPRRLNKDTFMSADIEEFKRNAVQAILDVHVARDILKSQSDVDPNNVSLFGISLGGILTYMSAGVDPGFRKYGALVGGADLATIINHRKTVSGDSETGKALAGIEWDLDQSKLDMSEIEPLVWAHRLKGTRFYAFNAEKDELIDLDNGVKRILEIYKADGNQVFLKTHSGTHRPDLKEMGIWKFIKSILWPVMGFIGDGNAVNLNSCNPYNN